MGVWLVVMWLGPEASIEELLHKRDSIYGNAANRVDIPKELYGAEQRNDEDVGCLSRIWFGLLLFLI
jgi:hypothetical protein